MTTVDIDMTTPLRGTINGERHTAVHQQILDVSQLAERFADLELDPMWGIRLFVVEAPKRKGEGTETVEVFLHAMFAGWRLTEVHSSRWHPGRYWCYAGPLGYVTALSAAIEWGGAPAREPGDWVKAHDGRRSYT